MGSFIEGEPAVNERDTWQGYLTGVLICASVAQSYQKKKLQSIHIPKGSADQAKSMVEFTFTSFLAITGSFSMTSPLPLKKKKKKAHQDHERMFAFSSGLPLVSKILESHSKILF